MAVYFVLYQNEGFCLKRAAKLKNKRKKAKERKQTAIERAVLRAAKFLYIYIFADRLTQAAQRPEIKLV